MKILRASFLVVLFLLAGVLAVRLPQGVETDLYGLIDSAHGGVMREMAKGLATQGRLLLEGQDPDVLKERAAQIRAQLHQPPQPDYKETLAFIDTHKAGLLAPATRELLLSGQYAQVAEESAARLFGPVPPLFSAKRDPFLLGTDYALALETNLAGGWSLDAGDPVFEQDETCYRLLTVDLATVPAAEIVAFLVACEQANEAKDAPCRIWCSGPAFHTARASEQSKREINLLSGISLALVVLFGWLLFRSFRFLPQLLLALGVGALAATGMLFAFFPRPHVLTFVFGTSLIGLSVDYVYHARAAGDVRKIMRPLALSLATTLACFAPLLFAAVSVLRQMALFTSAGLLAVAAFVVLWPCGNAGTIVVPPCSARRCVGRWSWVVFVVLAGLFVCRHPTPQLVMDPTAFYRPDAYLAQSEKKLLTISPVPTQRFAFVAGETLQEALEREEAAGVKGLSAVIPSLKRQRENAALKAALVREQGAAYTAKTGLKMPSENPDGFLDPEQLPEGPLRTMLRSMRVAGGLVSPYAGVARKPLDSHVTILKPRVELLVLFTEFTASTLSLLTVSLLVFGVLLVVFFKRNFVRFGFPICLSLQSTVLALMLLDVPITFFTLLCFFVLMGLGIDYTIFHRGHPAPETRRVVLYSFLTSFAGLGLLALTSFPVTRSMGLTFAIGLFFAYLFSLGGSKDV